MTAVTSVASRNFRNISCGAVFIKDIFYFTESSYCCPFYLHSFTSEKNCTKMDTVVKSMLDDDEPEEEKKGLMLFGRDLSKIPCFRESFLYGIGTGVGVGIASFMRTSKPMLSQHIGFGTFTISTLVYWSFCRWQWSKQRFDAQLLQEALKDKILYEGTVVEKEMERKGVLKSA